MIAERIFIAVTWTLLALIQLLIVLPHMLAMLVTRGCDAIVVYISEIQSIAVARLKEHGSLHSMPTQGSVPHQAGQTAARR